MADRLLPAPGDAIEAETLRIPRAIAVARVLQQGTLDHVHLTECRRGEDPASEEVVVFAVDVEIGQHPVNDIRPVERIALVFQVDDATVPEVLALRADFPLVPHVNLRDQELPRSLCLYDEPWSELRLRWTPRGWIERVREWLALTAAGTLHAPDQPLEPLLAGSLSTLVVPSDVLRGRDDALMLREVDAGMGRTVIVAQQAREPTFDESGTLAIATTIRSDPLTHGVIARAPTTLHELHHLLAPAGFDLLAELRDRLRSWRTYRQILPHPLIVLVVLPKTSEVGGEVVAHELRGFRCDRSVAEVGEAIGVWELRDEYFGPNLLYQPPPGKDGSAVRVALLNATLGLWREQAARLNGLADPGSQRIVAVGVGALGSQVVLNRIRAGWGEWMLIDEDFVLPHNLARYPLDGRAIGRPKAEAIAEAANTIIDGPPIARTVVADVLAPGEAAPLLSEAMAQADAILDMSASVAVARHLARDIRSSARRLSFFLNPVGSDSVLLAEDASRTAPLDVLEMQYYRTLIAEPALASHLHRDHERIRYGGTCRDLSLELSQDFVALHAAIGSQAVREAVAREEATILICQADGLSVRTIRVEPAVAVVIEGAGWTLYTDEQVLEKLASVRAEKLPNETGGVLIGTFDTSRRIVYVADALPSPADSEEWPTLYVRGCRGLKRRIDEIGTLTDEAIGYVGEWHSHPDGYECTPSSLDRQAFATLRELQAPDDLPPVMLIAGSDGRFGWHIGSMLPGSSEDSIGGQK